MPHLPTIFFSPIAPQLCKYLFIGSTALQGREKMTETQLIIAICVMWTLNGFVLGMAAGVWYMDRQARINGEAL